ncbi:hypothetical protein NJO91_15990 [Streptomyces microflavus]|uniref:hypothetical protein n=1 Tax=Streptomyces microflavus TaxID=1919 RepID=UPI0029A13693|nr:hypothetical protein [Streptomyces microflavus]MDX2404615.1 hypothetical protein [Streptomyces microflavus]
MAARAGSSRRSRSSGALIADQVVWLSVRTALQSPLNPKLLPYRHRPPVIGQRGHQG